MTGSLLYTIGHSNHAIEVFLDLLARHDIDCLVDVRSAPYSRFSPHFSRKSLEAHLQDAGVHYVYQGQTLGGRPGDESCYDGAGQVDYDRIARKPWYRDGVQGLIEIAGRHRAAMMCSEEDPAYCHRNLLIADTLLRDHSIEVQHVRGDGRLEQAVLVPKQTRLF